jgi:crotonobetainyl-CoA:carnitine CoA-transferase CaiB-like acyl-CoA transferase
MLEVFLINAALHCRWATGEGQYIDLSMAEATTMLLPEIILDYAMNQRVQPPQGNRHPVNVPQGNYPCRGEDQWIGLAVANEEQWRSLVRILACPELLEDARFRDPAARRDNHDALDEGIAAVTRHRDALELTAQLQQAGIPAGPALRVDQLWGNPHLRERGFFQCYQEQDGATREMPGVPWRFDGRRIGELTGQPRRGQHNSYVLDELLGAAPEQVEAWLEEQVIF